MLRLRRGPWVQFLGGCGYERVRVTNRIFYPFIGLSGSVGEGWRQERCLTFDLWVSPPAETLERRNAELAVYLEITRSRRIHMLLRMWGESREELKRLISMSGAGMDFGFGDDYDPEALDKYRLDPSR